jgi:hypothetical protein
MNTYRIVRHFFEGRNHRVVKRGLTLEEARAHCNDRETSSKTAVGVTGMARTFVHGPWFDGYEEER